MKGFYTLQRRGVEAAEVLTNEAIAWKLDTTEVISPSSSMKWFAIADLGCSVGPNTIIAVEDIIDSVILKCQSFGQDEEALEFQVFFKDYASKRFQH